MDMNGHRVICIAKEDILRAIVEFGTDAIEEIRQELSTPEVFTESLDQLVMEGLVCLNGQSVKLTPLGEDAASVIANRHRVIEEYFLQEVDDENAHQIAHTLEHVIAEEVVHSLKKIRELEEKGHHLTEKDSGEGLITRVNHDDIQLFDRMISMGICPGQWITIIKPIHGGLILLVGNTQLAVGWDIVSKIEVMFP